MQILVLHREKEEEMKRKGREEEERYGEENRNGRWPSASESAARILEAGAC